MEQNMSCCIFFEIYTSFRKGVTHSTVLFQLYAHVKHLQWKEKFVASSGRNLLYIVTKPIVISLQYHISSGSYLLISSLHKWVAGKVTIHIQCRV